MTDLTHYDVTMPGDDLMTTEDALEGIAGFLRTEQGEALNGFPAPHELEDIAGRFYRQRIKNRPAIAFCGLPGAGKTILGEQVADIADAEFISMGDAHPEAAPERIAEDSESLGEFAARTREDDPRAIPNWTVDLALDADAGAYVIDGVRSVDDYMVLNNFFENFTLVKVESDFYTRLDRVAERDFDAHDLVDRDAHELEELGVADLIEYDDGEYLPDDMEYPQGLQDYAFVNNGDDLDQLAHEVTQLLDAIDAFAERLPMNQNQAANPGDELVLGDLNPTE